MARSNEQTRFFKMIRRMPELADLWDPFKCEYDPEHVDRVLGVTSHGKAIMLRFFLGVWRHDNEYGFDLFDAVSILDEELLEIITDWMADPFWP